MTVSMMVGYLVLRKADVKVERLVSRLVAYLVYLMAEMMVQR